MMFVLSNEAIQTGGARTCCPIRGLLTIQGSIDPFLAPLPALLLHESCGKTNGVNTKRASTVSTVSTARSVALQLCSNVVLAEQIYL